MVNPNIVLPWAGVQGEANFIAEIRGSNGIPQISGAVDFKGPLFPIPQFPQALTDYSGLVFIQNNKASIRSLQAKLGGGDVVGSGEIRFGKGGVEFLDVQADGDEYGLGPPRTDAGLRPTVRSGCSRTRPASPSPAISPSRSFSGGASCRKN